MQPPLSTRATAKINLSLTIKGRRADGWHELESLVAFARFGDGLKLLPDAASGLAVFGPMATLAGPVDDNLVLKAARHFATYFPGAQTGRFELTKRLPVAAGVGGGSSDAASALRLLAQLNHVGLDNPQLLLAAQATGADVPVCLAAKPRFMSGIGAQLGPVLALAPLFSVLVNPGIALQTPAVFKAMGLAQGTSHHGARIPVIADNADRPAVIAALKRAGNDMEDAACSLEPVIVDVLAVLAAARGARLVRMSGSGATCFALFEDCRAASRAARAIARSYPNWWVKATLIG